MSFINNLVPLNLMDEKEKFFHDFSYNPQFKYIKNFTQQELEKWGKPNKTIYKICENIINNNINHINNSKSVLKKSYVINTINNLSNKLGIAKINVFFDKNQTASALINQQGIHFRLPLKMTKHEFHNKLNHEIQTHYLRRLNHKKNNHSFITDNRNLQDKIKFRETEEGLATLHSYIEAKDKCMIRSFLNYYSTYYAYHHSFSQTFLKLIKYNIDPQKAWNMTVKKKRGLTDTSQKRAMTKGITYLTGAIKVYKWIKNNDPRYLYYGRYNLTEIKTLINMNKINLNMIILPLFLKKNLKTYKKTIDIIGEINKFNSF